MNTRIKDYLGIVIIVAVALAGLSAVSYVRSYSRQVDGMSYRTFSVTGEAKVNATPDIARFTFSVITEGGKDLGVLQQENTDKANKAIDAVKALGVEAKDIKTSNYDIQPRSQYASCGSGNSICPPPEIVGYTITQTVEVKVRDFTKTNDTVAAVVKAGSNSVSQLSFTIDDPTALQDQARNEAIAKAKEKAKSVAEAGDFRMGKLVSITDNQGGYPTPYAEYGRGGDAMLSQKAVMPSAAPSIEPGSQDVVIQVMLTYEIR